MHLYLTDKSLDWRRVFSQIGSTSCISLRHTHFRKNDFGFPFWTRWRLRQWKNPGLNIQWFMTGYRCQAPTTVTSLSLNPDSRIARYMTGHCVAGCLFAQPLFILNLSMLALYSQPSHLARYYDDLRVSLRQIHFTKALTSTVNKEDTQWSKLLLRLRTGHLALDRTLAIWLSNYSCRGEYQLQSASEMACRLARSLPLFPRSQARESPLFRIIFSRTVYEVIFPRVVKYSKEFQTVQSLDINSDGMGATATVTLGSVCDRSSSSLTLYFSTLSSTS